MHLIVAVGVGSLAPYSVTSRAYNWDVRMSRRWESLDMFGARRLAAILAMAILLVAGCGDRVPESKAAKELGNAPKQAIDKATSGANAAIQQGVERAREEDKKP
ncbi:MAG: hypothetical protein ACKVQQ_09545 [Burkholderiales bacterium]